MNNDEKKLEREKIEKRYQDKIAWLQKSKAQKEKDLECIERTIAKAENDYRLDIEYLENNQNENQ